MTNRNAQKLTNQNAPKSNRNDDFVTYLFRTIILLLAHSNIIIHWIASLILALV